MTRRLLQSPRESQTFLHCVLSAVGGWMLCNQGGYHGTGASNPDGCVAMHPAPLLGCPGSHRPCCASCAATAVCACADKPRRGSRPAWATAVWVQTPCRTHCTISSPCFTFESDDRRPRRAKKGAGRIEAGKSLAVTQIAPSGKKSRPGVEPDSNGIQAVALTLAANHQPATVLVALVAPARRHPRWRRAKRTLTPTVSAHHRCTLRVPDLDAVTNNVAVLAVHQSVPSTT